jgi:hypothetical protein
MIPQLERDLRFSTAPFQERYVYSTLFSRRADIAEVIALGHEPALIAARLLSVDRSDAEIELAKLRAAGLVGEGLTFLVGAGAAQRAPSRINDSDSSGRASVPKGWRIIPGFQGYRVSEYGMVIGLVRGIAMSRHVDGSGYYSVTLHRGREAKRMRIHRLVALAFIGPCPTGHVVNHIDGDKLNNHRSNLEYVTPLENVRHAIRTGLAKTAADRIAARRSR